METWQAIIGIYLVGGVVTTLLWINWKVYKQCSINEKIVGVLLIITLYPIWVTYYFMPNKDDVKEDEEQ